MQPTPPYSPDLIAQHGLKPHEYEQIVALLGREPSFPELGIFSVMWSEHCAYKHSRRTLKLLPTDGPRVLQGPGENAGALDIGGGLAVVFKVESHNHPSAVEPYQGAATGVGGILRDIHTMGARPVANLNSLCFGLPIDNLTRRRINGIVTGIADYGNCTGIPTVGGEVHFDPSYYGNPLVNAMCVGIAPVERLARSAVKTPGALLLYYGSATGRDGIHGATFASEQLGEDQDARRPNVQVGDPFMGKKIMEATLALIAAGIVEGIQDMGAAGLTCSSTEMAAKGAGALRLDLDKVPQRAAGMTPYEILLSESQERMLAAVAPGNIEHALAILREWDVEGCVVGEVVAGDRMQVTWHGRNVVDIPLSAVINNCPVYTPESRRPEYLDYVIDVTTPAGQAHTTRLLDGRSARELLRRQLALPQLRSKQWVWRQFDHSVQVNTVIAPGGDAAVLRVKGADVHLALTLDSNGLFTFLDPFEGGKHVVCEAARNVAVTGARPIGLTNCLNFANPEKPHVFWQFHNAVAGMAEAARALQTPVVSGNVSFYNETEGEPILPTPSIGMVGLIAPGVRPVPAGFQGAGDVLLVAGAAPSHLGASTLLNYALFYNELAHSFTQSPEGREFFGPLLPADLAAERARIEALLEAAALGLLRSAHDAGEGGLAVALVECCLMGPAPVGATVDLHVMLADPADDAAHTAALFGEGAGQIVLTCRPADVALVRGIFAARGVPIAQIGETGGRVLDLGADFVVTLDELQKYCLTRPF
ncbi:MAG: phosphoribosylformylglycinamidine synthase subunit PurL [Candidatus Sumerlaeia bacterium]